MCRDDYFERQQEFISFIIDVKDFLALLHPDPISNGQFVNYQAFKSEEISLIPFFFFLSGLTSRLFRWLLQFPMTTFTFQNIVKKLGRRRFTGMTILVASCLHCGMDLSRSFVSAN